MFRWNDTASILSATQETNPHTGDPEGELSWDDPDETVVDCSIQPRTSNEGGRDEIVVGEWIGFFPADTELGHDDRIAWRGRTLEVAGEVAPWVRRGAVHHLEVPLRQAGGDA